MNELILTALVTAILGALALVELNARRNVAPGKVADYADSPKPVLMLLGISALVADAVIWLPRICGG